MAPRLFRTIACGSAVLAAAAAFAGVAVAVGLESPSARPAAERARDEGSTAAPARTPAPRAVRPERAAPASAQPAPTATGDEVRESVVRTLRILTDSGDPVVGERVRPELETKCRTELTDVRGEVSFSGPARDEVEVVIGDDADRPVALRESLTVITVRRPDVEFVAIDAETGAERWDVPLRVRIGGTDVAPSRGYGRVASLAAPRDGRVEVAAGAGTGPLVGGTLDIARRTRRARVLVPAFDEAPLDVLAVDADDRPVAGATAWPELHGRSGPRELVEATLPHERWTTDANGGVRMWLPRIRLNAATISLSTDDGRTDTPLGGSADVALDRDPESRPLRVVLSPIGPWGGRRGGHRNLSCACCGGGPPPPRASLTVQVVRRDGTPAEGVRVTVGGAAGRPDAEGRLRFESLVVGEADVLVLDNDFFPTAAVVRIGGQSQVWIREAEPRRVELRVVDESGAPVPCVRVLVRSHSIPSARGPDAERLVTNCPVAVFDGDVEVLTPRTDRDGRIRLLAPLGKVRYDVSLVGASGGVVTDADEVRITLPRAR